MSYRQLGWGIACACLLAMAGGAAGQAANENGFVHPSDRVVVDSLETRPSEYYQFETHDLDSADGERHYRVVIALPRARRADQEYPVLYMLDGNAVLDTLRTQDIDILASRAKTPPVLVFMGYAVNTRNDRVSRSYDYTPPVYRNGRLVPDPVVRGDRGGGADVFLDFVEARIKPLVERRVNIAADQQSLWGHSFGGLFVLHTLFTRGRLFANYIAGDPSLWWHGGELLRDWRRADTGQIAGKRVAISRGTKPRPLGKNATARQKQFRQTVKNSANFGSEIIAGLRQSGATVSYTTYPQNGHGEMLRASLREAFAILMQ